jgi:hypothetical protein
VFGVNTSQEVKRKVIESCRHTNISFLQTVIYKDLQNKIVFLPIDALESIDQYLEKLPQVFTTDSIMNKYNGDYIAVNSLRELPYYSLQPNDWEEYYKKKLSQRGTTATEQKE